MHSLNESPVREPCSGCQEPTVVGTPLFSDRRTLPDGSHLCGLCNARLAAACRKPRMTDEEVRQYINNGVMAAIVWGNGRNA